MKRAILLLVALLVTGAIAAASTKDDNRMKTAEQAFAEKRYADAKTTFEDLKNQPQYREKCYLYLAMIYNETGQVENSLAGLDDFKRYVTEKTDISLLRTCENLADEISKNYSTLSIAIFEKPEAGGVDAGFYNLVFRADGGLNPSQEARLKIINRVLSQSQGMFSWKSDGTFLKGQVRYFPVRLYDTSPMTAEINGTPVYFRFDFQTKQGLWIPEDVLGAEAKPEIASTYKENIEPIQNQGKPRKSNLKLFIIGAAVVVGAAAAAVVATQ